jgi:hypothetical protein
MRAAQRRADSVHDEKYQLGGAIEAEQRCVTFWGRRQDWQ